MDQKINRREYSDEAFAPVPTGSTLFWRKNFIWQAYRFVVLNLKILKIVVGGHS